MSSSEHALYNHLDKSWRAEEKRTFYFGVVVSMGSAWVKGHRLRVEGHRLRVEGRHLRVEGRRLPPIHYALMRSFSDSAGMHSRGCRFYAFLGFDSRISLPGPVP
jgi:hypothetical protein